MYTLRFHFVGGGYCDRAVNNPDVNKEILLARAELVMKLDCAVTDSAAVNIRNVTMIEIIEQED